MSANERNRGSLGVKSINGKLLVWSCRFHVEIDMDGCKCGVEGGKVSGGLHLNHLPS